MKQQIMIKIKELGYKNIIYLQSLKSIDSILYTIFPIKHNKTIYMKIKIRQFLLNNITKKIQIHHHHE